ncbi:MAG: hypothetical protein AB7O98_17270 [Hyphomonadaceae bacterium]
MADLLEEALGRHGGTMSKELAFLTIIMGAVHADNRVRKEETEEVNALIDRVRTLKSMPEEERNKRRDDLLPCMNDPSLRNDRVGLACSSILNAERGTPPTVAPQPGLAIAVFTHACDIVYTDLEVTDLEKKFLVDLVDHLKIDRATAANIVKVIAAKNEY